MKAPFSIERVQCKSRFMLRCCAKHACHGFGLPMGVCGVPYVGCTHSPDVQISWLTTNMVSQLPVKEALLLPVCNAILGHLMYCVNKTRKPSFSPFWACSGRCSFAALSRHPGILATQQTQLRMPLLLGFHLLRECRSEITFLCIVNPIAPRIAQHTSKSSSATTQLKMFRGSAAMPTTQSKSLM